MNDSTNAKQQIVDKIKASSNILVTVGVDPTVDELASALGLTILLNNLGKHATAVASGQIPAAISFLDPEKTFENSVDSLRDFIIALDKSKADHLRYKVDGDVVKIFITPYRATITQDDLDFSQGDYNVELVLALGVNDKDHLDKALSAHGRILHDATVATLGAGEEASKLGSIDWNEPAASSISEMLTSMSEALKTDKPVLDEQIATAFLTGIVAATDRFSNDKTSSKVMTMAAQLMAAGANQQLIAAKLQENNAISDSSDDDENSDGNSDGTHDLTEGKSTKLDKKTAKAAEEKTEEAADAGSLAISHEKDGTLDEVAKETAAQKQDEAADEAEAALAEQLETVAPAAVAPNAPTLDDLKEDIASANADVEAAAAPLSDTGAPADLEMPDYEPTMGGTLNATTEQAAEDKRREEADSRNKTILSHGSTAPQGIDASQPSFVDTPFTASSAPHDDAGEGFTGVTASPLEPLNTVVTPEPESSLPPVAPRETLAEIDAKARGGDQTEEAQAAVDAAYNAAPFDPANNPVESVGAQPLDSMPAADQPAPMVPPAPVLSELPPLPDFSAPLPPPPPPMPPEQLGQMFDAPAPTAPPAAEPQPNDPAQFKIPGQS